MARIRSIKPEFFTSSDIVKLTPLARVFYIGLWCEADREGLLKWDVDALKLRYLPGDNIDIDTLAGELTSRGLVSIFIDEDGTEYAEIPTFKQHQVINNREAQSVLVSRVKGACARVQGEGRKEGKGKEGRERKGTSPTESSDEQSVDAQKKSDKPKKRHGSEDDLKTAQWMFSLVRVVNATAKEPNYEIWADEIRLMREIDFRTHAEICALFNWAKRDAFWCSNIQSPGKLREKWDQLIEKRASTPTAKPNQPNQKFNFASADRSGDQAAQAASMARHGISIPEGEIEI